MIGAHLVITSGAVHKVAYICIGRLLCPLSRHLRGCYGKVVLSVEPVAIVLLTYCRDILVELVEALDTALLVQK